MARPNLLIGAAKWFVVRIGDFVLGGPPRPSPRRGEGWRSLDEGWD